MTTTNKNQEEEKRTMNFPEVVSQDDGIAAWYYTQTSRE